MVSSQVENPIITGVRISTVVPGRARGEEENEDRALTNVDLAVKLHYIRGVYFFEDIRRDNHDDRRDGVANLPPSMMLRIEEIKKPMFSLLDRFFVAAGRIRRSEDTSAVAGGGGGGGGRPYIKCNDAGVRIVEASCEKTIEEWLKALEEGGCDSDDNCHGGLCYDHVLGPDLGFSPLVYLQFTRFKCGGLCIGLSWAHLLGDVLSAMTFINTWAQIMAGQVPQESKHVPSCQKIRDDDSARLVAEKSMSLKELEPVGNHWLLPPNNSQNMKTHSFRVTPEQLDLLISNTCGKKAAEFSPFEIVSAVIWKSLSRVRQDSGPKLVTICCYDSCGKKDEIPNNKGMVLSTVEADDLGADVSELAFRIARTRTIANDAIDEIVGRRDGTVDYFVYGANLTFVNLEDAEIYELEVKGLKPVFANYTIDRVGDEGLVLLLPLGPKCDEGKDANGRTITVVLHEDQLAHLKNELKRHWNIA